MELILLLFLLASESIELRDWAAERLVRAGPPAWRLLTRALNSPDAEVRGRAAGILARQAVPRRLLERYPEVEQRIIGLLLTPSLPADFDPAWVQDAWLECKEKGRGPRKEELEEEVPESPPDLAPIRRAARLSKRAIK